MSKLTFSVISFTIVFLCIYCVLFFCCILIVCTIILRHLRWTLGICTPVLPKFLKQLEQVQKTRKCSVRNCVKLCKIKQICAKGNTLFYQYLVYVCTAGNLCSFIFVDLEVANVLMCSWRGKKVLWKRTATSKPLLSL